ncbi:MAG: glycosyltransferase [Armatimonadetes bacterium]|nr:glycosyltransferase [Armatimonadota bacterium]MDE2205615.1 glycosyltransferase [Armatimonadota bacterium]
MRVTHIMPALDTAGAEKMLLRLLANGDASRFEYAVISLTEPGEIGDSIASLGIPVKALGMKRGVPDPRGILWLARWLRSTRPDVVQTWMYHADLVGGLAARLAGGIPVAWCIRQTNLDPAVNRRIIMLSARLCARLSRRIPAAIVCCSEATAASHRAFGYSADRMLVLPNGYDLIEYAPDEEARVSVRQELGVPPDALLIGLMARFHPQKDHSNFLRAAAIVASSTPQAAFVLCGHQVTAGNKDLAAWIADTGLTGRVRLLGHRLDMPRIAASLDVAVSSSQGEGFPNAIAEAMCCGVPCVVTDVGGSAELVGDTGTVVPARDAAALAAGINAMLIKGASWRRQQGLAARARVEARFSITSVAARYESLYADLATRRKPSGV